MKNKKSVKRVKQKELTDSELLHMYSDHLMEMSSGLRTVRLALGKSGKFHKMLSDIAADQITIAIALFAIAHKK